MVGMERVPNKLASLVVPKRHRIPAVPSDCKRLEMHNFYFLPFIGSHQGIRAALVPRLRTACRIWLGVRGDGGRGALKSWVGSLNVGCWETTIYFPALVTLAKSTTSLDLPISVLWI